MNGLFEMKIIICRHCDMASDVPPVSKGYVAKCSRCNSVIYKNSTLAPSAILALCITALIFCIPAFTQPLISMLLLSITEGTSLVHGAIMMLESDPLVACIVLFCGAFAPTTLILCIAYSSFCLTFNYLPKNLPKIFRLTRFLTHWSMLDVYLLSLFVSIAKLMTYADLYIGLGFYFFIALLFINMTILTNYSNRHYWELYQKGVLSRESKLGSYAHE